mmetsp:Transcript_13755/g.30295  ORF Transcript_13755/g.30295 Transcript_13755/m.30295 type:complete len:725 (-) Transcript_13755:32-2206(-)
MTDKEPHLQKACLYKSGRFEGVFADGSGIILHPSAERVSYFSCDGTRHRFLTDHSPTWFPYGQRQPDDVRSKVRACLRLRGHYRARVLSDLSLVVSDDEKITRFSSLCRTRWPSFENSSEQVVLEDSIIKVRSLDGEATLSLPLHASTFTVSWLCPINNKATLEVMNVPTSCGEGSTAEGRKRLFTAQVLQGRSSRRTKSAATSVRYEHVRLEQTLLVGSPIPHQWAYPLLLVLAFWEDFQMRSESVSELLRSHCSNALTAAAAAVKAGLEGERFLDYGEGGISVPHDPRQQKATESSWGDDSVSPAAALGYCKGNVDVLWDPQSTAWFFRPKDEQCEEAVVEVRDAEGRRTVLQSSHSGRFWSSRNLDGQDIEILCTEYLPSGTQSAIVLAVFVWLQRELCGGDDIIATEDRSVQDCFETSKGGWLIEAEAQEPGAGILTMLKWSRGQPNQERHVRVLFEDSTRISFNVRCETLSSGKVIPLEVAEYHSFKIVDPSGLVCTRSFGTPTPFETYAMIALALLDRLRHSPEDEERSLREGLLRAESERRKSTILLQAQKPHMVQASPSSLLTTSPSTISPQTGWSDSLTVTGERSRRSDFTFNLAEHGLGATGLRRNLMLGTPTVGGPAVVHETSASSANSSSAGASLSITRSASRSTTGLSLSSTSTSGPASSSASSSSSSSTSPSSPMMPLGAGDRVAEALTRSAAVLVDIQNSLARHAVAAN